jgi:hypothetical protein
MDGWPAWGRVRVLSEGRSGVAWRASCEAVCQQRRTRARLGLSPSRVRAVVVDAFGGRSWPRGSWRTRSRGSFVAESRRRFWRCRGTRKGPTCGRLKDVVGRPRGPGEGSDPGLTCRGGVMNARGLRRGRALRSALAVVLQPHRMSVASSRTVLSAASSVRPVWESDRTRVGTALPGSSGGRAGAESRRCSERHRVPPHGPRRGAESRLSFRAMSWTRASLWLCRVGTSFAHRRAVRDGTVGTRDVIRGVVTQPGTLQRVAHLWVGGYSSNSPRDAGAWRRRTGARYRPSEALDDLDQDQRAAQCSSPQGRASPIARPWTAPVGARDRCAPGGARTHRLGVRKWPSARRHRGHESPKAVAPGRGDRCPRAAASEASAQGETGHLSRLEGASQPTGFRFARSRALWTVGPGGSNPSGALHPGLPWCGSRRMKDTGTGVGRGRAVAKRATALALAERLPRAPRRRKHGITWDLYAKPPASSSPSR